jgi:drug/metabolite transporter (DMT)-like permease
MPGAVTFGLALALACALATSVSFLFKQRGAVSAPPVRVRHPLRCAAGLFRSKWFAVGWLVALGAWGLHVGALALAPLSVVQAVLSAGLVFLAVLAERFFGFHLGRRQWTGLVITAVGLAIIGITQGAQPSDPPGYALAALISIECGVLLLATGLAVISGRLRALQAREGLLLGAAAGALFGISDIALKFLTHAVGGGVLELVSQWTFAALAASVIAFYTSARSLQIGPGVEVIALTSVAANLVAIVGGVLIFRDSIGTGVVAIAARMIAFGLVIAGAALIPAPLRVTGGSELPQTPAPRKPQRCSPR